MKSEYLLIIAADVIDENVINLERLYKVTIVNEDKVRFVREILSKYKIKNVFESEELDNLELKMPEDEFEEFRNWIPYPPEGYELHTIESIDFYKISEKLTFL